MEKAFIEITNICNLSCSFCPGTKRPPRQMSRKEFDIITDKLYGRVKYLYFHLMGEPTTHPQLCHFITEAKKKGFIPVITSNGTLLEKNGSELIAARPLKISISLQSYEGNRGSKAGLDEYLKQVVSFAKEAAPLIIIVLRLWNMGGNNRKNDDILNFLHKAFPGEWRKNRSGYALSDKIFIEFAKAFQWPEPGRNSASSEKETTEAGRLFCYGLRKQIGILCDGTVVPCCLDAEGTIPLGNLLESDLDSILNSERATAFYNSFSIHKAPERLCQSCGYAVKTMQFHRRK